MSRTKKNKNIDKEILISIMQEDSTMLLQVYGTFVHTNNVVNEKECYKIQEFQEYIIKEIKDNFTYEEINKYNKFEDLETLISEIGITLTSEYDN